MTNTSLQLINTKGLPLFPNERITYNPRQNLYITLGVTSVAGNTYYKVIRLSDHLALYYDLGQGYIHTFLNGITLYYLDGQTAKVIAQKSWGGCNWVRFSEQFAKQQSVLMLRDILIERLKAKNALVNEQEILEFSNQMIEETYCKRLPNHKQ